MLSELKMGNKTKFNWIAFLLNGAVYYAGYGKVKKGILLALIGFFPLTAFFVNLYAGFKANKELPVKKEAFHWGKAISVLAVHVVILIIAASLIVSLKLFNQGEASADEQVVYTKSSILNAVTGVWEINTTKEYVIINLTDDVKTVRADGQIFDVEVDGVDLNKAIIYLIAGTNKVSWRFSTVMSEDGSTFDLKFRIADGTEFLMSYVGDLIQVK